MLERVGISMSAVHKVPSIQNSWLGPHAELFYSAALDLLLNCELGGVALSTVEFKFKHNMSIPWGDKFLNKSYDIGTELRILAAYTFYQTGKYITIAVYAQQKYLSTLA